MDERHRSKTPDEPDIQAAEAAEAEKSERKRLKREQVLQARKARLIEEIQQIGLRAISECSDDPAECRIRIMETLGRIEKLMEVFPAHDRAELTQRLDEFKDYLGSMHCGEGEQ